MVNKRGWVRIIEATICAILIIATVLIYAQDNRSYFNAEDFSDVESILDELIKHKDIRENILNKNSNPFKTKFSTSLKTSRIGFNVSICDISDIESKSCIVNYPPNKNIHSYERIIGANLTDKYEYDNTKILKVSVFEN
jgi:hypothetical protein